jgi:AraC-like DNA-binding protein/ligand-binding sensor protein
MNSNNSKAIIENLLNSPLYRDYERSFSEVTGLPVTLRPVEMWQLPHHGRKNENKFCSYMATRSRACANCLQVQQRLAETATGGAQTVTCPAGLTETAVPVRLGEQLVGFLQTGQLFCKKPTAAQFDRTARLMQEWGVEVPDAELQEAYFDSRFLRPKEHDAVVRMLSIFAQHLSLVSNQVMVQQQNSETPVIARAKEYILEHQTDDLSLAQVARAVNTSTFYFCKIFKKSTGINFTDYLSRVRIEKAKNLLLNPNLRISEIAYEVGFQSLTHFNRVFKKILGQSPTEYRGQLPSS